MRPYEKIETLFLRDAAFNVTDELRRPVIGSINKWVVTEKIDGTNIRITFDAPKVTEDDYSFRIGGRTDNAQIHAGLFDHLSQLAWRIMPEIIDVMMAHNLESYTLYGEGYGEKIQNGGKYRKGQGFILFDILVNDRTWLTDDAVTELAESFDIPRVPIIGVMDLPQIIEFVKWGFQSWVAAETMAAEGIVARPIEPLYDSRGRRLILKLKTSDYHHAKSNVKALPVREPINMGQAEAVKFNEVIAA